MTDKTAVLFARSSLRDAQFHLDQQVERLRHFIAVRGIEEVALVREHGSAGPAHRAGLAELLATCERLRPTFVLSVTADRLSRDLNEIRDTLHQLGHTGAQLRFLNEEAE